MPIQHSFIRQILDPLNRFPQNTITSRSMIMSTKSNNMNSDAKKQMQVLITDIDKSRIKIGGQRWILPGDYVVHSEYGVGR